MAVTTTKTTIRKKRGKKKAARRYYGSGGTVISRTKTVSRKRARKASKGAGKKRMVHAFTYAQLNPFSSAAYNARVPDESTAPSTPFYFLDEWDVVTTTTNNNCVGWLIMPYPGLIRVGADASAGTSISWGWTAAYAGGVGSARYSTINSNFNLVRPVAHGIRITSGQSVLNATGYIHICLVPYEQFGQTTWNAPISITQMEGCPGYTRIPISSLTQKPVYYINKYNDSSAFFYRDPSDAPNANFSAGGLNQYGWHHILVICSGFTAPSGGVANTLINIENLVHSEGQAFWTAGALQTEHTHCAPDSGVMDGTAEVVGQSNPCLEHGSDEHAQLNDLQHNVSDGKRRNYYSKVGGKPVDLINRTGIS
jgi:hypothetical protein